MTFLRSLQVSVVIVFISLHGARTSLPLFPVDLGCIGDDCFTLFKTRITQQGAATECASQGYSMLSLEGVREREELGARLYRHDITSTWLGLTWNTSQGLSPLNCSRRIPARGRGRCGTFVGQRNCEDAWETLCYAESVYGACSSPLSQVAGYCIHFNETRVRWYESYENCRALGAALLPENHPLFEFLLEDRRYRDLGYFTRRRGRSAGIPIPDWILENRKLPPGSMRRLLSLDLESSATEGTVGVKTTTPSDYVIKTNDDIGRMARAADTPTSRPPSPRPWSGCITHVWRTASGNGEALLDAHAWPDSQPPSSPNECLRLVRNSHGEWKLKDFRCKLIDYFVCKRGQKLPTNTVSSTTTPMPTTTLQRKSPKATKPVLRSTQSVPTAIFETSDSAATTIAKISTPEISTPRTISSKPNATGSTGQITKNYVDDVTSYHQTTNAYSVTQATNVTRSQSNSPDDMPVASRTTASQPDGVGPVITASGSPTTVPDYSGENHTQATTNISSTTIRSTSAAPNNNESSTIVFRAIPCNESQTADEGCAYHIRTIAHAQTTTSFVSDTDITSHLSNDSTTLIEADENKTDTTVAMMTPHAIERNITMPHTDKATVTSPLRSERVTGNDTMGQTTPKTTQNSSAFPGLRKLTVEGHVTSPFRGVGTSTKESTNDVIPNTAVTATPSSNAFEPSTYSTTSKGATSTTPSGLGRNKRSTVTRNPFDFLFTSTAATETTSSILLLPGGETGEKPQHETNIGLYVGIVTAVGFTFTVVAIIAFLVARTKYVNLKKKATEPKIEPEPTTYQNLDQIHMENNPVYDGIRGETDTTYATIDNHDVRISPPALNRMYNEPDIIHCATPPRPPRQDEIPDRLNYARQTSNMSSVSGLSTNTAYTTLPSTGSLSQRSGNPYSSPRYYPGYNTMPNPTRGQPVLMHSPHQLPSPHRTDSGFCGSDRRVSNASSIYTDMNDFPRRDTKQPMHLTNTPKRGHDYMEVIPDPTPEVTKNGSQSQENGYLIPVEARLSHPNLPSQMAIHTPPNPNDTDGCDISTLRSQSMKC